MLTCQTSMSSTSPYTPSTFWTHTQHPHALNPSPTCPSHGHGHHSGHMAKPAQTQQPACPGRASCLPEPSHVNPSHQGPLLCPHLPVLCRPDPLSNTLRARTARRPPRPTSTHASRPTTPACATPPLARTRHVPVPSLAPDRHHTHATVPPAPWPDPPTPSSRLRA